VNYATTIIIQRYTTHPTHGWTRIYFQLCYRPSAEQTLIQTWQMVVWYYRAAIIGNIHKMRSMVLWYDR